MTATPRTLYRRANVSQAEATASLFKRFPSMDLVSFEKKAATADEALAARASEGELVYAATIRVAEFPPEKGDDDSSEAPEPKDDAPAEEPSDTPDEDGDDDAGSDDFAPDFGEKGDHEDGAKPKKLSPEEQTVHLLQQILDAIHGGGDLGGPPPGGPGDDLGLPDIGAPGKGEGLPPPGPGGPGGPGKAPLPPPIKAKSPVGVGAFAAVATQAEATMAREGANEVNNKTLIAEAKEFAPGHRVAKIQRTGLAQVGDDLIDLAEARVALVTLVSA